MKQNLQEKGVKGDLVTQTTAAAHTATTAAKGERPSAAPEPGPPTPSAPLPLQLSSAPEVPR